MFMIKVLENPKFSTLELLSIFADNPDKWFTAQDIQKMEILGISKGKQSYITSRLLKLYKLDLVRRRKIWHHQLKLRRGFKAAKDTYTRIFPGWEWQISNKGIGYFDWKLKEIEKPPLPPPEEIEETEGTVERLKRLAKKYGLEAEKERDYSEDLEQRLLEEAAEKKELIRHIKKLENIIKSQERKILRETHGWTKEAKEELGKQIKKLPRPKALLPKPEEVEELKELLEEAPPEEAPEEEEGI